MTRFKIAGVVYVCMVAGLAIGQVAGAQSTLIVPLLLVTTLPCGLIAYIAQYPIILGLGAAIHAPQEGSVLLAVVFVAIWAAAAIVNLRLAASLTKWIRTRRTNP